MTMKPVCVPCRTFYQPAKNGTYFEEGMPAETAGAWDSYKLWVGDLWECQACGAQIIVGVGREPLAEHHQPDYAATVARVGSLLLVEDG